MEWKGDVPIARTAWSGELEKRGPARLNQPCGFVIQYNPWAMLRRAWRIRRERARRGRGDIVVI